MPRVWVAVTAGTTHIPRNTARIVLRRRSNVNSPPADRAYRAAASGLKPWLGRQVKLDQTRPPLLHLEDGANYPGMS